MKNDIFSPINKEIKIPYYLQVKEQILKVINEKKLKTGDKINNEFELCRIFNVSRPTIRQAISELVVEGYVEKLKGKGTYVAERKLNTGLMQEVIIFSDELKNKGVNFKSLILERKIIKPSDEIRVILNLDSNDEVNYVERLRTVDEKPFYLTIFYIPVKICKGFVDEDLENYSSVHIIEDKYNVYIAKIKRFLEPVSRNYYIKATRILNLNDDECIHYMQTFLYKKDGAPVGYYKDFLPGSKSRFTFYYEK